MSESIAAVPAVTVPTKGQNAAADVAALLRARNACLWIVTKEESRVERYLIEAGGSAGYVPHSWDVAQGAAEMSGELIEAMSGSNDPGAMLNYIRDRARDKARPSRDLWIMRDLPVWLDGGPGAATLRALRNLARTLPGIGRDNAQAIVILSPSGNIPPELANHVAVIEWPLPDRAEMGGLLDSALAGLSDDMRATAAPNGTRESAIDSAVGLSSDEASACFAKSLIQTRGKIDPATVAAEKKRIIARENVLECVDPIAGGLDSVGGLDVLKAWFKARSSAYSISARAYGLPAPKGVVLVGVPGGGKSLIAKAIASEWKSPLLRFDAGAMKSKYVGESEAKIRRAFRVIEAMGRCVVWIDEIEKSFTGASGGTDGGVAADALGAILSWLQDRQGESFVIATANDVTSLPPELLRKGRFDDLFFVDLPNETERAAILNVALRQHGRAGVAIDAARVAAATDGFTGSEMAAIVPDSMFAAFADGARQITADDLITAARAVTPLSKTMGDKLDKLRAWSKGRARLATSTIDTGRASSGNAPLLDIA